MKLSLLALVLTNAVLSTALPQEPPQDMDFAPFCADRCFNELKNVAYDKSLHPNAVYQHCAYLCDLKEHELQTCTDRCVGTATEAARKDPFTVDSWWEMKRGCDDKCAHDVSRGFVALEKEEKER
ncbi:hypothetical protein CP532_6115 [Ophiocordyceps camponoti-leonardi (nom. inval.)]|nr:hypothetical protein CP532_6115 [Ophiocordyceps camponoti-leonardi (nom. inval.)]